MGRAKAPGDKGAGQTDEPQKPRSACCGYLAFKDRVFIGNQEAAYGPRCAQCLKPYGDWRVVNLPDGVRMSDLVAKLKQDRRSSFERSEFRADPLPLMPSEEAPPSQWDEEVPF